MSAVIEMFVKPSPQPSQLGVEGIRYDFNDGCRVELPPLENGEKWRVKLSDMETFNGILETVMEGGCIQSTKKYYIPFQIEVWRGENLVFTHKHSLKNRPVLVQVPVGTLGDCLAWFPYVAAFQEKHACDLTCGMSEVCIPMFEKTYPHIKFMPLQKVQTKDFYAIYKMGLYFNDWDCVEQPVDFRYVGLHKTAAYILGLDPIEAPAKIHVPNPARTIKEPYVCIAVQSSTQCKYWNHPGGWLEIVKFLKAAGYRVICIDRESTYGAANTFMSIPNGAEDMTGNLPLVERAQLLMHADFFVGLSSGLSWLAWSVGTPVVMISGFTHPENEFFTPYRVINYHVCNSCWNDPRCMFDHQDFFYCPRHKGTDRQFECTRLITPQHVKSVIEKVPAYLKMKASPEAKPMPVEPKVSTKKSLLFGNT